LQLKELVERSIEHVKPLAEKRGHDISCHIPAGLPFFRGDRARMSLVFDNLLGNAIKFMTRKGEIRVIAEMEKTGIHVRVSDTGIGISERECRKIFKRFYSVEDPGKESCAGVGLGLSIVKGILDEHHGKIWVESEEGKGSTFHMLLPAKKGNGANESA
jgi:signal transduction histidine kinase